MRSPGPWRRSSPSLATFLVDRRSCGTSEASGGAVVGFRTTAGDVDLMLVLPGVDSFEGLLARSMVVELQGRRVRVASVADIIAMKRVAGRPKDLDHIEELEEL